MGLYLSHPSSLLHDTGPHPENAGRIRVVESTLEAAGWPALDRAEPPAAERAWLERVHEPALIDKVERTCAAGGGAIDLDTVVVAASWEAALRAAGAAAEASRALLAGEHGFAFCGLRPPGHHAESNRSMGFCLFNNAAVGTAHGLAECGAERVLILDWDVHHGNGTAEIFDRRDDVLYISIHQSPLYPGTGGSGEIGTGAGEGMTLNLPVPPGSGEGEFVGLVEHVVCPVGRSWRPDLIVISAGYDAHAADPLANCLLHEQDYGSMAAAIRDLGEEIGAPVLVCLEGGYDQRALAMSVLETVHALAGGPPAVGISPAPLVTAAVERVRGIDRWREAL
jgi:acetoin utilization deacetylase AcuC-like enzyme